MTAKIRLRLTSFFWIYVASVIHASFYVEMISIIPQNLSIRVRCCEPGRQCKWRWGMWTPSLPVMAHFRDLFVREPRQDQWADGRPRTRFTGRLLLRTGAESMHRCQRFRCVMCVQKSGIAKLTQLAHHGRILIREPIPLDYSPGLLVFIPKNFPKKCRCGSYRCPRSCQVWQWKHFLRKCRCGAACIDVQDYVEYVDRK